MNENQCENCGKDLDDSKIVWLILSTTDGKYYKDLPEGHDDQGAFAFGKACAKKVAHDLKKL